MFVAVFLYTAYIHVGVWACVMCPSHPTWRMLAKQVSQHDHWSSVTWQIRARMRTCRWAKEKAQEIKCHPNALCVQNPQDAARLKDRLKHRGKLTKFFKKAGGLLILVCVIKQHLGLYDLWQWSGIRGSAAIGGSWSFVWHGTDRHTGQLHWDW